MRWVRLLITVLSRLQNLTPANRCRSHCKHSPTMSTPLALAWLKATDSLRFTTTASAVRNPPNDTHAFTLTWSICGVVGCCQWGWNTFKRWSCFQSRPPLRAVPFVTGGTVTAAVLVLTSVIPVYLPGSELFLLSTYSPALFLQPVSWFKIYLKILPYYPSDPSLHPSLHDVPLQSLRVSPLYLSRSPYPVRL